MSVRSAIAIVFAAGAALSLAACERANEDTADAPPTGATAPSFEPAPPGPPGDIDATRVVDRAPLADAPPAFDAKALAGTYVAHGAELELEADGTYVQVVHAESADADRVIPGTWTVEDDGRAVRLDPDSKGDEDRVLRIAPPDDLVSSEDRTFHRISP